jgi:hypothetical protein
LIASCLTVTGVGSGCDDVCADFPFWRRSEARSGHVPRCTLRFSHFGTNCTVGNLVENPQAWFQESAGALALVNQSDTRIGVEPHSGREADLLVAELLRGSGPFVPLDLIRATDEDGAPVGYRLATGVDLLNADDRGVYEGLPDHFRHKDVQARMGGHSGSNVSRFLRKCESLQIVKAEGKEYTKAVPSVEPVERVECQDHAAPATPPTPVH